MSRTSELSLLLRCEYSYLNMVLNRIKNGTARAVDFRKYSNSVRAINHFKQMCEEELEPIHYPSEYHYPDPQEAPEPPSEPPKKGRKVYKVVVGEQISLFGLEA